ncbi:hypothetical protein DPM18_04690 [Polynucleobacter paneuropaeus]|nr:hypothetical protein DPM18_04690 [Polynucleobacter paneuropaeus]
MNQESLIVEEVKYIFREIYNNCERKNLVKGNRPDYHNYMGKMNILAVASRHFKVPKTLVTFGLSGVEIFNGTQVVAKSLSSGTTATNEVLFTTQVSISNLSPSSPWFLQDLISSDADVTIFICGKSLFSFSRDRGDLEGLDWRKTINTSSNKEWEWFPLSDSDKVATYNFCAELGVDWGRIDLMSTPDGLIFLEFNANGQWVFLDYTGKYGLVDTVVEYLTPAS